jgi:hypothetical protein
VRKSVKVDEEFDTEVSWNKCLSQDSKRDRRYRVPQGTIDKSLAIYGWERAGAKRVESRRDD